MIRTYFEVDKNGYIVNKFKLDSAREDIPNYLVERWVGENENPRYIHSQKKWVDESRDWEKYGFNSIEEMKMFKDKELNKFCEKSILDGFNHTIDGMRYHFSYDREAQVNLQETYQLFQNNALETVMWTAHVHGGKVRIPLNKNMFYELYYTSVKHKLNTISYYRDILAPQIARAKTAEELEKIQWDRSIINDTNELKTDDTIEHRIESNLVAQAQGDAELVSFIMMGMMM